MECIHCAAGSRQHGAKGGGRWHTLRVRCPAGKDTSGLTREIRALEEKLATLRSALHLRQPAERGEGE